MTVLHNCDCHTFEQVVKQLQKAIACSESEGWEIAWQVHNTGKAVVKIGPEKECVRSVTSWPRSASSSPSSSPDHRARGRRVDEPRHEARDAGHPEQEPAREHEERQIVPGAVAPTAQEAPPNRANTITTKNGPGRMIGNIRKALKPWYARPCGLTR